jgi:hypothetical protein
MTRRRLRLTTAFGLTLAGVSGAWTAAPAWADKPLSLSVQEQADYARITAKWADGDETAPKIAASISNQVLILQFDQKVSVNLEALKAGLPAWAALARLDPDGKTARIGLKQAPRLHVSTSVDLTAVDLITLGVAKDPPDIVSPLAAKRAAAAEKARVAALPPPMATEDLEVRGSQIGDSSRVAFYWPGKVSYKVAGEAPGELKLLFAKKANADLAYMHISPPQNVADFKGENTDRGYLATLKSKDGLPIKHFMDGDVVVIDISKPAPLAPVVEAPKGEKAAAKPAAPSKPAEVAAVPEDGKPMRLTPPKDVLPPEGAAPAEETPAVTQRVLGGPERKTDMSPNWKDAAPASGVVDVKVAKLASGVEMQVAFAAPTPAAVFSRRGATWAVFAANADLKVDPAGLPAGYHVRAMRGTDAAILRIDAPKGVNVSAEAADAAWTVRFAPTGAKPQRFVKPERRKGPDGKARIETMLVGASGLVWFDDPVIGDQLAAVVSYGPSSSSPASLDFVEASMPATAHGLAIAPKSDDVVVTIEGERVIVAMGAEGGPGAGKTEAPPEVVQNPAFIDFAKWGGLSGDAWYDKREKLERDTLRADPATPEGGEAMMNLARFLLGHGLAEEALGVLAIAGAEREDTEIDPQFLGMRGAANALAGRGARAEGDLSRGPLRADPSAALWRGLVAVDRKDWERAADYFRLSGDQMYAYPPEWSAKFAAASAEASLNTNDYDTARRRAELAIASGQGADAERGRLVLANLTAVIDSPGAAFDAFSKLAKEASEPIAVQAELRRLETGVLASRMTANEAAGELEALRFRWRGDGVEMATVGILADQYMRVGRFRDALTLAQSTAMRDPNAPGARDLRIRLTDYFRRLYLNGEVDRLDPIQALALFYEFADLTPIGTDGDQMIRKLAQRLVAFDLLEPAASLLQHQVDNRMRGVGKAAIAVDLASIYLMDKRPDRALAAIGASRQPSLPKDVMLERRLIEAAAYRDLGRYDHVVELVEPLDGAEAKSLLADAHWRDRKWAEAGRAYLAMLPPGREAVSPAQADIALRAAIAGRMAKDMGLLADLRAKYMPLMEASPHKASFDLITAQADASGAALTEAVRRVADAPRVDAFAAAMKQRFESARAPAAAPTEAPPAAAPKSAETASAEAPAGGG